MYFSPIYIFCVTVIYGAFGDLFHQAISNFTCKENYAAIVTKTGGCPMISYSMLCVNAVHGVNQWLTFKPGDCVAVIGTPTWNFEIDVKSNSEFMLHLRVRFDFPPVVTRDITRDGDWQGLGETDLTIPGFPFAAGTEFNITLCAEENHFQAWLDDTSMFKFNYQYPITAMTHLHIEGDAEFKSVVFF